MNQPTLFEQEPNVIPFSDFSTVSGQFGLQWTGSATGNGWHQVCQGRMQSYGFRLLESRYRVAGEMEIDGFYRTQAGMIVAVEYKERINLKVWRECVGQAYLLVNMLRNGGNKMIIIILTGAIASDLEGKPGLVNAAGDLIALVANPQHADAEKMLRSIASASKDGITSLFYQNLFDRVVKQGGFPGLHMPVLLS